MFVLKVANVKQFLNHDLPDLNDGQDILISKSFLHFIRRFNNFTNSFMDLKAEILKEHSKAQSQKITDWVGNDKKRFRELLLLFLHGEYRVVQRSARMVGMVADAHPALIKPHLEEIVKKMNEPAVHVAVKRNVVRILQHIEIPERLQGIVMSTCFELLADPKETIAVRVFSMTVLASLSKTYPDIRQELKAIVNDIMEQEGSPGFRSRARKLKLG